MRSGGVAAIFSILLAGCASTGAITSGDMKAYEVSLATSGADIAMAWHGGPGKMNAIYLQHLDASAHPRGAAQRLTDGANDAYEPDLQLIDGDPLIAWYEKNKSDGSLKAWVARLDADGRIAWRKQLDAGGGNARNPVVRIANDEIAVAWIETPKQGDPAVWIARLDERGHSKGESIKAGGASTTTWNLNATADAKGVFYIVYDAQLGTRASELQLLVINGAAVTHRSLSADDGHASLYPDLGINGAGQAALTWFDERDGNQEVYLSVLPLSDLSSSGALHEQRITHTKAESIGAYLAWNGDQLALAWCDSEEGRQELYGQIFGSAGRSLTPAARLTDTPAQSSIPSVRAWKAGFVIAWNEYQLTSDKAHIGISFSHAMTRRFP